MSIISWHTVDILTANIRFQFAEICRRIGYRKLDNEVSVRWHVDGTRQRDCGTSTHRAWVLTTDGVVSRCWCRHARCHVSQTDDEIVRSFSLTKPRATISCAWKLLLDADYHTVRLPTTFKTSKGLCVLVKNKDHIYSATNTEYSASAALSSKTGPAFSLDKPQSNIYSLFRN